MDETPRDLAFNRAIANLCGLRAKQARERGEPEFHIGDLDKWEYRFFFDEGMDAALDAMREKYERLPA